LGFDVAGTRRLVRVNGTYNIASRFKGPPSREVDSAWEAYWKVWLVSVDQGALSASLPQHPDAAVRLRVGTHDKRYLATLEATYQLHCLYNLFRASYLDAYPDERADCERDPLRWHERVDHCVDILRQKLEWYETLHDTHLRALLTVHTSFGSQRSRYHPCHLQLGPGQGAVDTYGWLCFVSAHLVVERAG